MLRLTRKTLAAITKMLCICLQLDHIPSHWKKYPVKLDSTRLWIKDLTMRVKQLIDLHDADLKKLMNKVLSRCGKESLIDVERSPELMWMFSRVICIPLTSSGV